MGRMEREMRVRGERGASGDREGSGRDSERREGRVWRDECERRVRRERRERRVREREESDGEMIFQYSNL